MQGKTILLVDDEKDIVKVVKNRLEKAGYQVVVAYDGPGALEKAKESPGLILLDIMMPGMDGYEVLKKMRDNPETRFTPVIMFTVRAETSSIFKAQDLGVTDYIMKPYDLADLLKLVKKHVF